MLTQSLVKEVQIFYSFKDLSSCPSHICFSQESITLPSKPGKLKSVGCTVKHKYNQVQQASWRYQSNVSGYTVTVPL